MMVRVLLAVLLFVELCGCAPMEVIIKLEQARSMQDKMVGYAPVIGSGRDCNEYSLSFKLCFLPSSVDKVEVKYVLINRSVDEGCPRFKSREDINRCIKERSKKIDLERDAAIAWVKHESGIPWLKKNINVSEIKRSYLWKSPEGIRPIFDWVRNIYINCEANEGGELKCDTRQVWRSAASTSNNPWQ